MGGGKSPGTYTCQIDKIVTGIDSNNEPIYRDATEADHERYKAFEQAYTDGVNQAIANKDKTAVISYVDHKDQTRVMTVKAAQLGKEMIKRTFAADPKNLATGAANQNATLSRGGRNVVSIMGSDTLTGRGARVSAAHEALHNSPMTGGPLMPLNDPTQTLHLKTYDAAANCLTGKSAC